MAATSPNDSDDEGGFTQTPPSNTTPFLHKRSTARTQSGWDPIPANLIAYFMAAASFCLTFNLIQLPELPFPLIGNLLKHTDQIQIPEQSSRISYVNPALLLLILWCLHFLRRFGEVLFIHIYRRKMSPLECIGAVTYYTFFGFWIGLSLNIHLHYFPPADIFMGLGALTFIVGEIGNCVCHMHLKLLRSNKILTLHVTVKEENERKEKLDERIIPNSCLFYRVSCPHYLFEIISWLGFALASFVLSAFIFFITSLITVAFYAYKKQKYYKSKIRENDIDYNPKRKALIPFVF